MLSFDDQVSLLERTLADVLPESREWVRHVDQGIWRVEIVSPTQIDGRKLIVELRGAELAIGFYVGPVGVGSAPYELNADISEGREAETIHDIAEFVADLLNERLVLVVRRGFWRGGREFLESSKLTPSRRRGLKWIASWCGTYDWAVPR
jgi:hypothetical protein